jgi:hypothetical protein
MAVSAGILNVLITSERSFTMFDLPIHFKVPTRPIGGESEPPALPSTLQMDDLQSMKELVRTKRVVELPPESGHFYKFEKIHYEWKLDDAGKTVSCLASTIEAEYRSRP